MHAIDLFASAGGMTLGLREAGIKTICAVELDPLRVATYARHTTKADILLSDIRRIDFSSYRNKVEIVCGGPPCQPFSSGGLRKAHADERDMIPAFLKVLKDVRPVAFLMENVPGLLAAERKAYFLSVLGEMESLRYEISWKVINAAEYGVPQKRRRLFVVGMRGRKFLFPEPTHGPNGKAPFVPVKDVLTGHLIGEPNPSKVVFAKCPDIRPNPFDGHVFNGGGRPINPFEPSHTILASAGGNKTHFFADVEEIRRYHAHLLRGGRPRKGVLDGARRLTVLESAIVQTFPRTMTFCGTRSAQYKQVGDAVPPLLARVLGSALAAQLLNRDTCSRREVREAVANGARSSRHIGRRRFSPRACCALAAHASD